MTELKPGSQGAEVGRFYDYFAGTPTRKGYAAAYAFLLGKRDLYYGNDETSFTRELQRRLGVPITGRFGDVEAARTGYRWTGAITPPAVPAHRKIWITSSPGSGADAELGPSHDLGERCRAVLNLNHEMMRFQKGGYLGFLGGDPKFSYDEVIWDQYQSMRRFLAGNADAQEALRLAYAYLAAKGWREENVTDDQLREIAVHLEFEHHHSGYSQSAQGVEEACELLYGDGGFVHPGDPTQTPSGLGEFRLLRHTLKLIVNFGNPSTPLTGIARRTRSAWLAAKIRNVNYDNDFYAKVPASDKIRPAMYAIIVKAEMELPFFVHVLRLGARIIPEWLGVFGGFLGPFSPLAQLTVAGLSGLNAGMPLLGSMFGMAGGGSDTKVDDDLYNLLKPTGLLQNIPGLIGLIGALPGLDAHGRYPFDPVMMDRAYAHIAEFRR